MHLGCVGHAIWFIGCHHFLDLHIVKDDSTMSMNETRLDLKDPGKVFRVKWWQSKKALIWVLRQTVIIHLWTYRAVLDYPNAHPNDSSFMLSTFIRFDLKLNSHLDRCTQENWASNEFLSKLKQFLITQSSSWKKFKWVSNDALHV